MPHFFVVKVFLYRLKYSEIKLTYILFNYHLTVSSLQKHLFVVLKNYIEYASEESLLYLISQDKLLNILFLKVGSFLMNL